MSIDVDILNIWISPGHDFKGRHGLGRMDHGVITVDSVECHAGRGLVGDRFYDYKEDFKGQITLFDKAVAEELQKALNLTSLDESAFRRNVMISGIDLNTLIGKQFTLGDIELSGSEECHPCYWMDQAIGDGAFEWLKGRGGLRCRITSPGRLQTGSTVLKIER
ncbi:MOSC domain-containing protein [Rubellicoccus peritrichatus]|uniref:MOSC domain-containing protein n=1 Tax=Rubellicoccus peritrichatus TaxID=3080537 RepID=A0AAQ3LFM5_9BACT|nr:MOSC domain-containing protein [Puniceicoccus sp. CR14]WOO42898.1 MOSC domain-containing protein [Puniceicoccus sp. CR14]